MGIGAFGPYTITVSVCLLVSLSEILHVKTMVKLPYGTYCELQGDCRSKAMVSNKKQNGIYDFLSMNNCN